MSNNEMVQYQNATLEERYRYAQAIAGAGELVPPGLRDGNNANAGKVMMVMEHATMLGLHPIVGVNMINIIDGKISVPPALMSALVRRANHVLRVRTEGVVESGDFKAIATLVRSDDEDHPFEAVWTPQRAQRAGLCTYSEIEPGVWKVKSESRSGRPLPWQNYTEALCKARAISEVCMEGATDVMMGAVYTPEELGASVDDLGVVTVEGDGSEHPQSSAVRSPAASEGASSSEHSSEPIPTAQASADGVDWLVEIAAVESSKTARALYGKAREAGALNSVVIIEGENVSLADAITKRGVELLDIEAKSAKSEPVADQPVDGEIIDAEVVDAEVVADDDGR